MFLANSSQIREADRIQIEENSFPGIILMEFAGKKASDIIMDHFPNQKSFLILAGPGNNGGDGLVIARYLHLAGKVVQILLSHDPERYKGDALINYDILRNLPVPIGVYSKKEAENCLGQFFEPPILIDSLLGTGIQSTLRDPITGIINFFRPLNLTTIAIDLPSGLDANTGAKINDVLSAQITLTFQLPKICHYITPASNECGEVLTIDIGIWPEIIQQLNIHRWLITDSFVQKHKKQRPKDGHKGTFGHVLIIGGSEYFAGAIAMTAYAAVHTGAGLCTVITPKSCQASVNNLCPEAMCIGLGGENDKYLQLSAITEIEVALKGKTAVLLGPGMGQNGETRSLIQQLLPKIKVPIVIDADGLNYLAAEPDFLQHLPKETIITPHPGEMRRLTQRGDINQRRLEITEEFSLSFKCVTLLKGAGTIVALPNGKTYINTSGNPGMATGGSGDILTGIIGGLIAQGYKPEIATPMAAYLHGKAGDILAKEVGEGGVTATGIVRTLGKVW